jgi:hypothetical protein
MGARNYGNVPLWSTTAGTQTDPSTATLVAELIIPSPGSTDMASLYEVRFSVGASTGAIWRLECAQSSGLGSTAIRLADNDSSNAFQRAVNFTGSNQTSEFVYTFKAKPGDRFRAVPLSSFTGTAAAAIQAECLT